MPPSAPDYAALFDAEHRFVWALCYRMTGNAADADELTQETFVRAMESPPARTAAPWRPWLVRVATNLARDRLRRRRRGGYRGTWLPSPIETGDEEPPAYELPPESSSPTEGRYELIESVSYAFLLALEALTPQQRAGQPMGSACLRWPSASTSTTCGSSTAGRGGVRPVGRGDLEAQTAAAR